MREATEEIIRRAIARGKRKARTVYISKSANGRTTPLETLDPDTPEGKKNLEAYLTPIGRHYTISGLGAPEEKNAISWRSLNLSLGRRLFVGALVVLSSLMKGTPWKNALYRWMGVHVGRNVEIMQLAWLDHFRPDLIFIGDGTLIGAYTRVTVHAYEGAGKFRYGVVEIGANCTIGAGTGIGPILIGDGVRTLPGTTLSPYFARIRAGAVVGYSPPPLRLPEARETPPDAPRA
jgi:acetyltransferase-like isoleucine patch superfamily enzyme